MPDEKRIYPNSRDEQKNIKNEFLENRLMHKGFEDFAQYYWKQYGIKRKNALIKWRELCNEFIEANYCGNDEKEQRAQLAYQAQRVFIRAWEEGKLETCIKANDQALRALGLDKNIFKLSVNHNKIEEQRNQQLKVYINTDTDNGANGEINKNDIIDIEAILPQLTSGNVDALKLLDELEHGKNGGNGNNGHDGNNGHSPETTGDGGGI